MNLLDNTLTGAARQCVSAPRPFVRGALLAGVTATLLSTALTLMGCNTTEGVGKDIESAGAGLKDAAQDAKD